MFSCYRLPTSEPPLAKSFSETVNSSIVNLSNFFLLTTRLKVCGLSLSVTGRGNSIFVSLKFIGIVGGYTG